MKTQTQEFVTTEKVLETEVYKSFQGFLQMMLKKRSNIVAIRHGFNVCLNIGFDKWKRQTNATIHNQRIINELLTLNNN